MSENLRDYEVDLYELSKYPEFAAIYELLTRISRDHYAPMPRTAEERIAWETSNAVDCTIRDIQKKLNEQIEVGKRLSEPPDAGGESNAEDSGHQRRRT